MVELVPSEQWPNGGAALEVVLADARSVSVAVAFVTVSGAKRLLELFEPLGDIDVELVAQAGGVTSPEALQKVRDRLGAQVSVVIGRDSARFHPKLWLVRSEQELVVLAGSGNLTEGGLERNVEQFELTRMPIESEEASAHEERFLELTADAYSLETVEDSVAWKVWEQTIIKLKSARSQISKAERDLSETQFVEQPEAERGELLADLYAIYHATVAKDMITPKGKLYRPTRFLVGINRAADSGDPFELVRRLCRRQTGGFDIILAHDEPYLTVESLVVDEKKSYHHLFTAQTKELAAARLEQFPGWPG
jgi:HKD family nuclease